MQNNQGIMQISENKDGSAKVLFRIRKAEMADVDEIMAVMHEAFALRKAEVRMKK